MRIPDVLLSSHLYFSYGQFLVYDASVDMPGLDWRDEHVLQGFARRQSVVNVGTLHEFGNADLTVYLGDHLTLKAYDRIIAVPFTVLSGKVKIEGPEEFDRNKSVFLQNGDYRLVIAQLNIGEEFKDDKQEAIDLFFESPIGSVVHAEILRADRMMKCPTQLVEDADIAQV